MSRTPHSPWLQPDCVVYVAEGVVAEQIGLYIRDAANCLRAYAVAIGVSLYALAADVIAFRVRIDPEFCARARARQDWVS